MTLTRLFQFVLARNRTDLAIRQAAARQGWKIHNQVEDFRGEPIDDPRPMPKSGSNPLRDAKATAVEDTEPVGDVRPCVKSGSLRAFNPNSDVVQAHPLGRWTV